MKRTLWKLFPFTAIDSKAAEAWLNRLGKQGWRLGSAGLYTARFWQTGEPVSYAVTPEQGRREDFLVLCRDAGWELAARSRKIELYASRAGARPIPLETDQALECRSFLRRGIRWLALEAALTLMFLLNLRQLLDTGGPADWPALVLWLGELALWGGCLAGDGIYWLRVRRAGELLPRSMAGVWLRWWAAWALVLLGAGLLAVMWLRPAYL